MQSHIELHTTQRLVTGLFGYLCNKTFKRNVFSWVHGRRREWFSTSVQGVEGKLSVFMFLRVATKLMLIGVTSVGRLGLLIYLRIPRRFLPEETASVLLSSFLISSGITASLITLLAIPIKVSLEFCRARAIAWWEATISARARF